MSCWLHFLVIGMDHSWAWRRWYLMGGGEPSCLQDCLHGFLQEDPWTGESLLLWCTELWFCLPCSLLSRSWTPLSHGHHSQSCPQTFTVPTSSSFFVSIISNKARPLYPYPAPCLYHSIVGLPLCKTYPTTSLSSHQYLPCTCMQRSSFSCVFPMLCVSVYRHFREAPSHAENSKRFPLCCSLRISLFVCIHLRQTLPFSKVGRSCAYLLSLIKL